MFMVHEVGYGLELADHFVDDAVFGIGVCVAATGLSMLRRCKRIPRLAAEIS